jgi:hypothetical protein
MKNHEKETEEKGRPLNTPDEAKGGNDPGEKGPRDTRDKGIVQPMIDDLNPTRKASGTEGGPPGGPLHPPQPAELDQDAGGGYNPDGTFPQT